MCFGALFCQHEKSILICSEFNRKTAGCNGKMIIYGQPNRDDKQLELELFECEIFGWNWTHAAFYMLYIQNWRCSVAVNSNNVENLISMLHKPVNLINYHIFVGFNGEMAKELEYKKTPSLPAFRKQLHLMRIMPLCLLYESDIKVCKNGNQLDHKCSK